MEVVMIAKASDLRQSFKELRNVSKTLYLMVNDNRFQVLACNKKGIFSYFSKVREAVSFENITLTLTSETVKEILSATENCGEEVFVMIFDDNNYKIL
jgi:hypothetical protein